MGGGQSHEISASVREEHAEGALVTGLPQGCYRDAERGGERVVEIDELSVERGSLGPEKNVLTSQMATSTSSKPASARMSRFACSATAFASSRSPSRACGERQSSPFKVFFEAGKDVVPDGCDGMIVHRAQLALEGLGVGRAGLEYEALATVSV